MLLLLALLLIHAFFLIIFELLSMAVGFWLLTLSLNQQSWFKTLGSVFGWIIISISSLLLLITIIFAIVSSILVPQMRGGCPMCTMMQHRNIPMYEQENNVEDKDQETSIMNQQCTGVNCPGHNQQSR